MKKTVFVIAALICGYVLNAHEYILLAAKYKVKQGDNLEVHLFVSDGFNIQMERPYQADRTKRFQLLTKDGSTDLSQTANAALPIITRKVDFDGGGLLQLERNHARISMTTAKFFDYLREDHIEGIASMVDRTKPEQKERYTRYIKCLIQSGDAFKDTVYKTITGQAFEIILLQNPYALKMGSSIRARVLFNGKAFASRVITARNRLGNQPTAVQTSTTDVNGICTFRLNRSGDWFLHATQMIPCADRADSDWESYWATYSFGLE